MKLRKPTSDQMRLILLETSKTTGDQDHIAGRDYVSQATLTALDTFNPLFKAAIFAVEEKKSARLKETAEQKAAFEILYSYARDMMAVAKRRIYRLKEPLSVLNYYQMNQQGEVPNPTKMKEWLTLSEALVQGDAEAVLAGYPAMVNPSATELQVVLTDAQKEFDDMAMADRNYDLAQEAVAGNRVTAEEWIKELIDELEFALRKLDKSSKRRVMRTYGFEYEAEPGDEKHLPNQPANFKHLWQDPQLTLSCDAVDTAYSYEFAYSVDEVEWLKLYTGENNSYAYEPPAGARFYKVRAENDYGVGEWSDKLEFTKP